MLVLRRAVDGAVVSHQDLLQGDVCEPPVQSSSDTVLINKPVPPYHGNYQYRSFPFNCQYAISGFLTFYMSFPLRPPVHVSFCTCTRPKAQCTRTCHLYLNARLYHVMGISNIAFLMAICMRCRKFLRYLVYSLLIYYFFKEIVKNLELETVC